MKQKLLFVTRSYLFQNNGGSNASKAYIKAFSSLYDDITLVYPENEKGLSDSFIPNKVLKRPIADHRSNIVKGFDMYRGRLLRFYVPVRDLLMKEKFDVVVFDNSITSLGLIKYAKRSDTKIITIHHNVELEYLKDNPVSILYSLPYRHYVKKAEGEALLNSALNLTLTNEDADEFGNMFPGKNLHLHKIGVFEYTNVIHTPKLRRDNMQDNNCMVFVISGSLCFKQSEAPIIDFLKYYFPLMINKYPDAKLIITGRNPSGRLCEIVSNIEGVELIPNPEDINKVIARANYYLCPINTGSGQKLRVMDGLRHGLPALVHSVSARGYENLVGKSIIIEYNNPESFVKAVEKLSTLHVTSDSVYEEYVKFFGLEAGTSRVCAALRRENIK